MKSNKAILIAAVVAAALSSASMLAQEQQKQNDEQLLSVRETVWRAWFAGDTKNLEKLVPPGSIAINSGEKIWQDQSAILQSAAEFHASGGKLIRLKFPRTEVQHFGNVAITYSHYLYEIEIGGKRSTKAGRVVEIFVLRNGQWTNPGWHTDAEQ